MKVLIFLLVLIGLGFMFMAPIGGAYIAIHTTLVPDDGTDRDDYLFDSKKWDHHYEEFFKNHPPKHTIHLEP